MIFLARETPGSLLSLTHSQHFSYLYHCAVSKRTWKRILHVMDRTNTQTEGKLDLLRGYCLGSWDINNIRNHILYLFQEREWINKVLKGVLLLDSNAITEIPSNAVILGGKLHYFFFHCGYIMLFRLIEAKLKLFYLNWNWNWKSWKSDITSLQ